MVRDRLRHLCPGHECTLERNRAIRAVFARSDSRNYMGNRGFRATPLVWRVVSASGSPADSPHGSCGLRGRSDAATATRQGRALRDVSCEGLARAHPTRGAPRVQSACARTPERPPPTSPSWADLTREWPSTPRGWPSRCPPAHKAPRKSSPQTPRASLIRSSVREGVKKRHLSVPARPGGQN